MKRQLDSEGIVLFYEMKCKMLGLKYETLVMMVGGVYSR